ncbi:uncharacterized protein [Watersipora subatra]|uniref:uncharacterized protein n=1 Tax=Watersipora subatra TaxID=2589382 RepID=UPI00355C7354
MALCGTYLGRLVFMNPDVAWNRKANPEPWNKWQQSDKFKILYTHQKTKKSKVWQDGRLTVLDSSKRVIYDDKGTPIDTFFSAQQVNVGDDYETDKYLISVDSLVVATVSNPQPCLSRASNVISSTHPAVTSKLSHPSGRKGFNPPRRVIPSPRVEENALSHNHQVEPVQTKPASLFSTYSQIPAFTKETNTTQPLSYAKEDNSSCISRYPKKTDCSQTPAAHQDVLSATSAFCKPQNNFPGSVSITAEPTDSRSVRDILTLIAADREGRSQRVNKHRSSNKDNKDTMSSQFAEVSTHVSKPNIQEKDSIAPVRHGKSLWGDFLSQTDGPESRALTDQSSSQKETSCLKTPECTINADTTFEPFDRFSSPQLGTPVDCHELNVSARSVHDAVAIAIDTSSDALDAPHGCDRRHQSLLVNSFDLVNSSLESTQLHLGQNCHIRSKGSDNDIKINRYAFENKEAQITGVNEAVVNGVSLEESTKQEIAEEESPQVATFSLGSLPAVTDDGSQSLTDNDSCDAESCSRVSRLHSSASDLDSPRPTTTPLVGLGEFFPNPPSPICSTNSPVHGNSGDKHIRYIIGELCTDDLDENTSLFELDESLKSTQSCSTKPMSKGNLRLASQANMHQREEVNVWSRFTSPKNSYIPAHTKSIFEHSSQDNARDVVCCTELPSTVPTVFGATLPTSKINLARAKVQEKLLESSTISCSSRTVDEVGLNPDDDSRLMVDCWTLRFPPYTANMKQVRRMVVPVTYKTTVDYKQCMEHLLREYINVTLSDVCQRYHEAMKDVDITGASFCQSLDIHTEGSSSFVTSGNPRCQHGVSSKLVKVKKEGQNRGRMFYTCNNSRGEQCKYFEWADQVSVSDAGQPSRPNVLKLSSGQAVEVYLKGKAISFYCNTKLQKSSNSFIAKKWSAVNDTARNKSLYLQLSRREKATSYTKGDVWVISQSLNFDRKGHTFIAKSAFYGPNADSELELLPLAGYTGSSWSDGKQCHAIHVPNVSTDLICLANLQELNARTVPVLPWLIHPSGPERITGRFQVPVASNLKFSLLLSEEFVERLAATMVDKYQLNQGQAASLMTVARMFCSQDATPICLIKGVFGAGKSYLLAVVVEFIVQVLERVDNLDNSTPEDCASSKILISSLTNVAVDRILLCLQQHGFTDFLRVGSMRKIAKPILPHSLHALGSSTVELKELQDMLKDEQLSTSEKVNIRKGIAVQKSGLNKQRLSKTRVVGVTCAACSFPALDHLTFKVVLLDECSQMTEPLSLLPMKRAACSKLVLVGDPRQLRPTIQGSESSHDHGLEQTMFDRLSSMGVPTSELSTQYRCHPAISGLCRDLFYDGALADGVTASQRAPLCEDLPPICLYNVQGSQRFGEAASFYNDQEAVFVSELLRFLMTCSIEAEQIGVITLYKAQVLKIRSLMSQQPSMKKVQVATVDSFQGGERDIIILSCVRTEQMGFADDTRRINVALSRGKHHLLIVGHLGNLRTNTLWSKVVSYLEDMSDSIRSGTKEMRKWKQIIADKSASNSVKRRSAGVEKSRKKTARFENVSPSLNPGDAADLEIDSLTNGTNNTSADQKKELVLLDSSSGSFVDTLGEGDDYLTFYQPV